MVLNGNKKEFIHQKIPRIHALDPIFKSLLFHIIEPLSYFKKKILLTSGIGLPIDFFQKRPNFFFQRFQDSLKSSFQNGT